MDKIVTPVLRRRYRASCFLPTLARRAVQHASADRTQKRERPWRLPGPLDGRDDAGYSPRPLLALLHGLAVQREIEAVAFDFFADAQADHQVNDLENDQCHDSVVGEDDADADALIDHLAPVAFDRARSAAVCVDGEYAGQDGAGGAADAVHAEAIERVVVTEHVLQSGAAPVTDEAGGDADGERSHRADEAGRRCDRNQ